jgi:hypothetical protein
MTARAAVATACAALVLAALAAVPGPVSGQSPSGPVGSPTGWDGSNPFVCQLQKAGFGTTVPNPGADPYCVDFDKTHQNVDQLGVVDFLSNEPARVAAATPKCFYFQSDHWRGSVVQDNGATKTYEWDGHYFFDKARGDGGAWVTNFNINGHTGDPTTLPGIPASYAQFMGPGTGGVISHNSIPADPSCAARAQAHPDQIYTDPSQRHGTAPGLACAHPTGIVTPHSLGPVALRDPEARVWALLGPPQDVRLGFLRYCQAGAGKYLVGALSLSDQPGAGSAATVIVLTTNAIYRYLGVGRGASATSVHRRFPQARMLLTQGLTHVWATRAGSTVIIGLRLGRVRFVSVYDRRAVRDRQMLSRLLARSQ